MGDDSLILFCFSFDSSGILWLQISLFSLMSKVSSVYDTRGFSHGQLILVVHGKKMGFLSIFKGLFE